MSNTRFIYLDNLKLLLALLVVAAHVLLAYTFEETPYVALEEEVLCTSELLSFYCFCKVFLMELFFFIGGLFFAISIGKYPMVLVVKRRLIRYGIPIMMMQLGIWVFSVDAVPGTWFLENMLLFTFVTAFFNHFFSNYGRDIHVTFPLIMLVGLLIGLSLAFLRLFFPYGRFYSLPFFHIELAQVTKYLAFFILGFFSIKCQWIESISTKTSIFVPSIICAICISVLFFVYREYFLANLSHFSYALLDGLWSVAICSSLLFLFRACCNKTNRLLSVFSNQIMGLYLLTGSFIILYQTLLLHSGLDLPCKSIIIFVISTISTVLLSYLLRSCLNFSKIFC